MRLLFFLHLLFTLRRILDLLGVIMLRRQGICSRWRRILGLRFLEGWR